MSQQKISGRRKPNGSVEECATGRAGSRRRAGRVDSEAERLRGSSAIAVDVTKKPEKQAPNAKQLLK